LFPNPQDALPLPPRPSLERYRKLAKELVKACKSGDGHAIGDWAEQWISTLARATGAKGTPDPLAAMERRTNGVESFARRKLSGADSESDAAKKACALSSAQFVIARSHGFESWPKFAKHLESLARKTSSVSRFEAAADAIVSGDVAELKRILREDPTVVHATSTREHCATLLHYVAANGVESYRQKTPKNIVKIAQVLLDAGSEIDATANVYGGDCTTLGLAATSVHPERAGVQQALLQLLVDRGAKFDQPSHPEHAPIAGNRQSIVIACLANGRPKAAEFLASRGALLNLAGAAALGRVDIVKSFFDENGGLKPNASKEQIDEGFRYACGYGRDSVIEFLLDKGPNLAAHRGDGQTALHWAVIGGHPNTVKLLLRHDPPLDAVNAYGGDVLGQALWSAAHGGNAVAYIAILDALVAAGATVPERHVPVHARVDAWLAKHGSRAEPDWHWYGEEPRRRPPK
jgi:Ankyrin repeats (3 copies)